MSDTRNLDAAFARLDAPWQPHRLATVNDHDVKVARIEGEFVWHSHPNSDELFLVRSGEMVLQLRDRDVPLAAGDVFVVPRGVEHCPRADDGAEIVMIELVGTVNTGDAGGERTSPLREFED